MANESKDSYESALKQHGKGEFPAVLVDGRGNWNDFARTTNKNFHAQRLDSPELDVSLAMQEGGPEAAHQRILKHLMKKALGQSVMREPELLSQSDIMAMFLAVSPNYGLPGLRTNFQPSHNRVVYFKPRNNPGSP